MRIESYGDSLCGNGEQILVFESYEEASAARMALECIMDYEPEEDE